MKEDIERILSLQEVLFGLERFMTGEQHLPSDNGDVIQMVTIIRGQVFFTTCVGVWKFDKGINESKSTIELVSLA